MINRRNLFKDNLKVAFNLFANKDFYDIIRFIELVNLITKWKNAKVFYFDKQGKYAIDFTIFMSRLKSIAGEDIQLITSNSEAKVSYEKLPYPYVFYPPTYGAFIAFAETLTSELFFCECEREPIMNYFSIRELKPLTNYSGKRTYPLDGALFPEKISNKSNSNRDLKLKFKHNLCFKCNNVVSKEKFCHPMYGGDFEQKYGWYIQQEYLKNGIDPTRKHLGVILPAKCSPDIQERMDLELKLANTLNGTEEYDLVYQELEDLGRVEHFINDKVRTEFGYRGIGEHWINETTLKKIIISLFPNHKVLSHYRPNWLEGLEIDIYVPDLKLGFEYQGIQHFQAVKHWGGKEKLKIQQEHDARKKRICDELGIQLLYFDYTEDINTEYVKAKISKQYKSN